ncbi:MAG TPA: hypothetical protein VJ757_01530 [Pseudonocardiaceae bacterium]|nr:hypothetical protein [Pseudonocardiaceae bacterium]
MPDDRLAGGRAWSHAQAADLVAQAMRELQSASTASQAAADLGALARPATHRDHLNPTWSHRWRSLSCWPPRGRSAPWCNAPLLSASPPPHRHRQHPPK